jgi:16S rRNA (cytosine967-C5)-methyltransferase
LCATLLPNLDSKVVVDACAAPGGKTAHILERFNPKKLIALDHDAKRLLRVSENIERLGLDQTEVEIIAADATTWQTQQLVDCIVLDAPCSATGVIRRHPDIRLLRQSTDIAQTVALQQQILQHMWQQLKVGGTLLYMSSKWRHSLRNMLMQKKSKLKLIGALNRPMGVSYFLLHNQVMVSIIA